MKKVVIIGGGFAGLSAASFLSSSGYKIELLEASPKPGGRAYSFVDNETGAVIDNGQHILMGCYNETLNFIKLIGAKDNLTKQPHLSLNFIKEKFEIHPLHASGSFYPFNLLSAVLNYSALSFYEKMLFIKFFVDIYLYAGKDLKKLTVYEWLIKEKQTANLIKSFWEILAVAALNTDITKASAFIFASVLKRIFFRGNDASVIILPSIGLSETYCNNASKFIENGEGKISLSEPVIKLTIQDNTLNEIITAKRIITDFDYVISALPLYSLKKIIDTNDLFPGLDLEYSSILTAHLFLNENRNDNSFYGLIDSPVQWVFNKGTHLSVVISNADKLIEKPKDDIIELILSELKKYILLERSEVSSFKIIKEKRATFVPSNNILDKRPPVNTPYKNF
ncbi:MAG: hydroxysqualene dehydroxylase HpnE, partial [Ignavibacteriaceae bacterium]|nr:hydroxysqualene dehydroxylase HpnE [Ignavibacteriaceae bacterium]